MGYETVYGPSVPCPCGKGTATYSRVEHDTFPGKTGNWGGPEIECEPPYRWKSFRPQK